MTRVQEEHPRPASEYTYLGQELSSFALARRWKRYWSRRVLPFVGTRVLDVGAGIGANVEFLYRPGMSWLCLEPDPAQAAAIVEKREAGRLPSACEVLAGTLGNLDSGRRFDTILYVDVLEHIEADATEVLDAGSRLDPHGHLVVVAPAHEWLRSPFDDAVGHFRRYSLDGLRRLTPPSLRLVRLEYLDCVGVLASVANRVLLRSSMPTRAQIETWDTYMVPLSEKLDSLLSHRVGKSAVAAWQRRS